MSEAKILDVAVSGGNINGYTGINFKEPDEGKPDDAIAVKLKEVIPTPTAPTQSADGGRRRKRRTKVKSKKRANRRRRTRYQH